MPSVLFVCMHRPGRSPGQRYRFEQYLSDFLDAGIECTISNLLDEEEDRIFYSKGNVLSKAGIVFRSYLKRWRELKDITRYDAVFIYREGLMTGSTFFERGVRRRGVPMILDFDDAIWLPDISANNRLFGFMKRPGKTDELIALANRVITGNQYLADHARAINPATVVIPTTIDLTTYDAPLLAYNRHPVTIGWTGSGTTIRHFRAAEPVLMRIRQRYGDQVNFKVIGDASYRHDALGIQGIAWSEEHEVDELLSMDIGIMPLPDDDWSRGKCACKGLQYMALGIPAVMSAVGTNTEVICSGENGLLATDDESLYQALCQLIESPALREQLGRAGRKTVEERYSRQVWSEVWVGVVSGQ